MIPAMNTTDTSAERANDAPLRLASLIAVLMLGNNEKNIIIAIARPIIATTSTLILKPSPLFPRWKERRKAFRFPSKVLGSIIVF